MESNQAPDSRQTLRQLLLTVLGDSDGSDSSDEAIVNEDELVRGGIHDSLILTRRRLSDRNLSTLIMNILDSHEAEGENEAFSDAQYGIRDSLQMGQHRLGDLGELEDGSSIPRSISIDEQNRTRVSAIEVELQTMHEKVDELTSSLNDAMKQIENLKADAVFKDEKIASLEKEVEEASSLLKTIIEDAASQQESFSPGEKESIKEIELELDFSRAHQLSTLKTSKNDDTSDIEEPQEVVTSQLKGSSEAATALGNDIQDDGVPTDNDPPQDSLLLNQRQLQRMTIQDESDESQKNSKNNLVSTRPAALPEPEKPNICKYAPQA